jgi:hypothetical protein
LDMQCTSFSFTGLVSSFLKYRPFFFFSSFTSFHLHPTCPSVPPALHLGLIFFSP